MQFRSLAARRRARQRLRADQSVLRALLECAEVAAVAFDGGARLTHASRRASELLGGNCPAGLTPEVWIAALRPRTASGVPMAFEDLPPVRAIHGEVLRDVEVRIGVSGRDVLLNTAARPVEDDGGRRCGAVVVLEDVTRRRRWEAQLRRGIGLLEDVPGEL